MNEMTNATNDTDWWNWCNDNGTDVNWIGIHKPQGLLTNDSRWKIISNWDLDFQHVAQRNATERKFHLIYEQDMTFRRSTMENVHFSDKECEYQRNILILEIGKLTKSQKCQWVSALGFHVRRIEIARWTTCQHISLSPFFSRFLWWMFRIDKFKSFGSE